MYERHRVSFCKHELYLSIDIEVACNIIMRIFFYFCKKREESPVVDLYYCL